MSNLKAYVPFSILTVSAVILATALAWEPGSAEANKPAENAPVLRTSITETNVGAPICPDAVWPHVTKDCLLFPSRQVAERAVRDIVIDDRTYIARRKELNRIMLGL